ncbi:MAG TPA: mycothiol synthase [Jatrophihabitans sp.]|nr:mycothiol synthase [Jatrophihabitans sp.]
MIERLDQLTPAEVDAVRALVASAPGARDNPPISEDGMLGLTGPGAHLLGRDASDQVQGYARLHEGEAELVATSDELAAELLTALRELDPQTRLWAHGAAAVAGHAAEAAGLVPVRTLLQLRAPLTGLDVLNPPAGISIRPFRPGRDDAAWLAVNQRAFEHHPEQGAWRQAELDQRLAADWFDPAGFFLAWQGDDLLGYHWTKVHAEFSPPLGEVYVLGIAPLAQGLRLGTVLLNVGLRHLFDLGLRSCLLYVEADNPAAVHLYRKAGFTEFSRDVQYAAR